MICMGQFTKTMMCNTWLEVCFSCTDLMILAEIGIVMHKISFSLKFQWHMTESFTQCWRNRYGGSWSINVPHDITLLRSTSQPVCEWIKSRNINQCQCKPFLQDYTSASAVEQKGSVKVIHIKCSQKAINLRQYKALWHINLLGTSLLKYWHLFLWLNSHIIYISVVFKTMKCVLNMNILVWIDKCISFDGSKNVLK